MPEEIKSEFKDDHDTLIALYVEFKQLRKDIKELNDNQSIKLSDHESRIRRLEYIGGLAIGAILVLEVLKDVIIKNIFQ